MATGNNDSKVNIAINTTADLGGANQFLTAAEAEKQKIEQLVEQAKRLAAAKEQEEKAMIAAARAAVEEQAKLDVIEAKRRLSERGVQNVTAAHKNFGMVVNQVGYQVTDFATQVSMGTSAVQAFAQQAPQAIGAITQFGDGMKVSLSSAVSWGTGIGLIATEVAVGLQLVIAEWGKMQGELDKVKQKEQEYLELQVRLAEWAAKVRQEKRLDFIDSINKQEAEYLERQVKALERINELRAAQGNTAAAQAAAASTIAANTGGDTAAAKANAIAVGADNKLDELQGRLSIAEGLAAKAANDLESANRVYLEQIRRTDLNGDALIAAQKTASDALKIAQDAKGEADKDLATQRALFEEGRKQVSANTAAEVSNLTTEANKSVADAAKTTLTAIQQQAAESGNNLSVQARTSMQALEKILADGVVKPEEMTRLTEAMARIRGSREAADKEILDGLNSLYKTTNTVLTTLPGLVQRIQALESRGVQ